MRRREFITLLGGAAAARPLAARAQQSAERMRRVGVLSGFAPTDPEGKVLIATFQQALGELGWAEKINLKIEDRWATAADQSLMQAYAAELVALKSDVIVVNGSRSLA